VLKGKKRQNRAAELLPNVSFNWSGDESKMKRKYKEARGGDGRVRRRPASRQVGPFTIRDVMYVPGSAFRRFRAERWKSVGKLKAGFVPAADYFASATGGRSTVPGYVRTVPQAGGYQDAVAKDGSGYILLHDKVPYASRLVGLIIQTAQNRTEAYGRKVTPAQMNKIVERFNAQGAKA
jgi:hypothetical protein